MYSWYFTREELEKFSPSRKDGITEIMESEIRQLYCSFIRDVGIRLKLYVPISLLSVPFNVSIAHFSNLYVGFTASLCPQLAHNNFFYSGSLLSLLPILTFFFQTTDDYSNSNNVLPSLLSVPVPCQKRMAGKELFFLIYLFCCGGLVSFRKSIFLKECFRKAIGYNLLFKKYLLAKVLKEHI